MPRRSRRCYLPGAPGSARRSQRARPERYGQDERPRPSGFLVSFHAASISEARCCAAGDRVRHRQHPEIGLLLTTGTVASAKLARPRLPKGAVHQYVPLDDRICGGYLKHWQPDWQS